MARREDDWDRESIRRLSDRSRFEDWFVLLDRAIRIALAGWFCVAILTFFIAMIWVIWF